jgi:hypothetical protein
MLGGNLPQCVCPLQIPHNLNWGRTRAATVGRGLLTHCFVTVLSQLNAVRIFTF